MFQLLRARSSYGIRRFKKLKKMLGFVKLDKTTHSSVLQAGMPMPQCNIDETQQHHRVLPVSTLGMCFVMMNLCLKIKSPLLLMRAEEFFSVCTRCTDVRQGGNKQENNVQKNTNCIF
ncbi:hypothetical protein XENOCAPTIV_024972 [Xenoophorus captivus]|uniref:Uncharacterized protein n=1 Tax=Xenoophorus captivus TaxID=1517983 RepID=A0ABV0RA96_9TELE